MQLSSVVAICPARIHYPLCHIGSTALRPGMKVCNRCQLEFVDGKDDNEPSKDGPEGIDEKRVPRVGLESFGIF